jgi:hypothetical protein
MHDCLGKLDGFNVRFDIDETSIKSSKIQIRNQRIKNYGPNYPIPIFFFLSYTTSHNFSEVSASMFDWVIARFVYILYVLCGDTVCIF